jgi:hypothetical protein
VKLRGLLYDSTLMKDDRTSNQSPQIKSTNKLHIFYKVVEQQCKGEYEQIQTRGLDIV